MDDTELFDWLEDESCDLRCCSNAIADTGDYDIYWEVHAHLAGNKTRCVGRGTTPRNAIFDATLEPGDVRRHDYVPDLPANDQLEARAEGESHSKR